MLQRSLEESGQRLDNVDRTHLVQASAIFLELGSSMKTTSKKTLHFLEAALPLVFQSYATSGRIKLMLRSMSSVL